MDYPRKLRRYGMVRRQLFKRTDKVPSPSAAPLSWHDLVKLGAPVMSGPRESKRRCSARTLIMLRGKFFTQEDNLSHIVKQLRIPEHIGRQQNIAQPRSPGTYGELIPPDHTGPSRLTEIQ